MASTSTTPNANIPEKDTRMLSIGTQCSLNACRVVDFLPFKCAHCSRNYCADHFSPLKHECTDYDASKHDRIAPNCPVCNQPIAIPPDEDPNVRMDAHLANDCPVWTGNPTKKSTRPLCARKRCGKSLISPIRCTKCGNQFCVSHRFPSDHDCSSLRPAKPASSNPALNQMRLERFEALVKSKSKPQSGKVAPDRKPPATSKSPPPKPTTVIDLTSDDADTRATSSSASDLPSGSAVESLRDIFPHFDVGVLQAVLESVSGNQERAVEALLSM